MHGQARKMRRQEICRASETFPFYYQPRVQQVSKHSERMQDLLNWRVKSSELNRNPENDCCFILLCSLFVCLFVCLFWEYYLMLGLLMHSREMSDDEIPNVGREFDERHHWHSLKPLSDDYDRTKKSLTGKIPPSLLILKVNQQRTVFTVWNHSTSLNYIVNISLFRKTSKRSWAKETVFSS